MAFSRHPHPQTQRQFRTPQDISKMRCPKHCIHCSNGVAKYGGVGVYWPGLGLCRESAVGNKTIAMNCLRIMLGINPPRAHSQTIQSNENPFLQKFTFQFISFQVIDFLRGQRWLQNMFLICGSFPGLFLYLGGGSCVSVVE